MALRDLLFKIGFEGSATDLVRMDSAVDDIKDNSLDATSNLGEMESATKDLGDTTSRQGNIITDNWVGITAGLTAVAGIAEKVTRENAELFESISKVSGATEIQEDELRDLAASMTNVTFPLEDVTELMDIASEQGLKSADELEHFGNFWDMVGDATDIAGPKLGKAGAALRAVGIEAGNEQEAISAFGYITESTSGDVDEFLHFLERTGPQLREMGADVDDSAALLGILEHEFGMSGRTARSEFRKAVNESDGDLGDMLDTLGISTDTFEEYTGKVSESSDVIERLADDHEETYTVTEKLGQKVSELTFKYGDVIGTVSDFAPILIALGPLTKGVSTATSFLSKGLVGKLIPAFAGGVKGALAFTGALLTNPITWIVVGVVALGAAIWALATDFGGVTTWIKGKFSEATSWASEKFGELVDWFSELPGRFLDFGSDIVSSLISGITSKFTDLKDSVFEMAGNVGGWFKDKLGISSPSKVMIEAGLDTGGGVVTGMKKTIPEVEQVTDELTTTIKEPTFEPIKYSVETPDFDPIKYNVASTIEEPETARFTPNVNQVTHGIPDQFSREYNTVSNVSTTSQNNQGDFKPELIINVYEAKDVKESVRALKREWERLMAQYKKRNKLKLGDVNG